MVTRRRLGFTVFNGRCRTGGDTSVVQVLSCLRGERTRICVRDLFCSFLAGIRRLRIRTTNMFRSCGFSMSCIVSVNNSNAFLGTTDHIKTGKAPVLNIGVNQLKFLTSILPNRVSSTLSDLCTNRYEVRRRTVVRIGTRNNVLTNCPFTLGSVTILGHSSTSVVSVHARISNRFLIACRTSNLVIAAPANSATCGLSGNKPVVVPRDNDLYLAPITPRDLGVHPVMVGSATRVILSIRDQDRGCLITVSNEDRHVARRAHLVVHGTPRSVGVIGRHGRQCFSALERGLV